MSTQLQSPLSPLDLVERCEHCSGSGVFRKADNLGHMVPFGPCFQCVGKGFLTPEDFRRNELYQEHALARAIASDRTQLTLDEFFASPEQTGGTYLATSGENAGHWVEGPAPQHQCNTCTRIWADVEPDHPEAACEHEPTDVWCAHCLHCTAMPDGLCEACWLATK